MLVQCPTCADTAATVPQHPYTAYVVNALIDVS